MNGKGSRVWFQVSCHKDREEDTPFTVFRKLLKCESSVRKQIFCVCELSQEIFLLFNFLLCSLTCEMYITLQWCFSAHRDKGKAFWFLGFFFSFFFGCTGCLFPVWPFLYFRQVGATLCLQGAWLLVAMVSFVMSTSSRHTHFSSFATQAQYLSFSLVAPWHVRSSQNKDRTHVSRIGKLTFYHAATRMLGKLKK